MLRNYAIYHPGFSKKFFINLDLSCKERQVKKELRSELGRRKEADKSSIFICRGHIVRSSVNGLLAMV